jgi:ABC-type transport system involved in multi-copper enzyme maturation permease subunit
MTLGPIVSGETRGVARRARSYRQRCIPPIALALVIVPHVAIIKSLLGRGLPIGEMALLSQSIFMSAAATQVLLTMWLIPALVAVAIAEERERRTLTSLLATRLSSAEIVAGKLAAGLVQYTVCLATTFPIMLLLPLLGGVDPRLVLVTYAGTVSTALFVAGLSIMVSTLERRAARAIGITIGLASLWCTLPAIVQSRPPFLLPRYWPGWVYEVNGWVLASSPTQPLQELVRFGTGIRFMNSIFWMIALELVAGVVLIAWAVARLRPTSRRLDEGNDSAPGRAQTWRAALRIRRRRPPCGDRPVLWKEMYMLPLLGFSETLAVLIGLGLVGLIGYGTYYLARPAFIELFESWHASSFSDARRSALNLFLRHATSWGEFLVLLITAGLAAGTVAGERARETWDGLIATPLSSRDILKAKMMGIAWKVRYGAVVLLALWAVGLFSGAVHPVGFFAAAVVLGVSMWFMVGFGTYLSLVSKDARQASSRTLVPALLLSGSFVACYLPSRYASVFLGAFSAPFVSWLCLVSPREIRDVMSGEESFRGLAEIALYTFESPSRVLGTSLLGMAGFAAGALWFCHAGFNRFDRIVGRPERSRVELVEGPVASVRPWGRKRAALVVASILAAFLISLLIWSEHSSKSLREALAETDRMLPGWRLDDLEAARERVPDAKNAALRVTGAGNLLPTAWRKAGDRLSEPEHKRLDAVGELSPLERLSPESYRSLQALVKEAGPALPEALGLTNLPAGRFPVAWTRDGISTMLPHLAIMREVANLLACEATLQAEGGNGDASLTTCRALLNAGRSIGDEPLLVSQRERMDIRVLFCHQVERALAHGQSSATAMAMLQRSLEQEELEPILVFGIRGERALTDRFLTAVGSGEFSNKQIKNAGFSVTEMFLWKSDEIRAIGFRFDNRAEQIAALPAEEQQRAFERLEEEIRPLPFASRAFVPAILRLANTCLSSRARLRCAGAALACERYRIARGIWPSALADLVPEFVITLPTDPFDGKPLRFRREKDCILIYSVGEDRRDDGGESEARSHSTAARDLEFRLWEPSLRSAR